MEAIQEFTVRMSGFSARSAIALLRDVCAEAAQDDSLLINDRARYRRAAELLRSAAMAVQNCCQARV